MFTSLLGVMAEEEVLSCERTWDRCFLVFMAALFTALTTGLGALPFYFIDIRRDTDTERAGPGAREGGDSNSNSNSNSDKSRTRDRDRGRDSGGDSHSPDRGRPYFAEGVSLSSPSPSPSSVTLLPSPSPSPSRRITRSMKRRSLAPSSSASSSASSLVSKPSTRSLRRRRRQQRLCEEDGKNSNNSDASNETERRSSDRKGRNANDNSRNSNADEDSDDHHESKYGVRGGNGTSDMHMHAYKSPFPSPSSPSSPSSSSSSSSFPRVSPQRFAAVMNTLAAGMMVGASLSLVLEGIYVEIDQPPLHLPHLPHVPSLFTASADADGHGHGHGSNGISDGIGIGIDTGTGTGTDIGGGDGEGFDLSPPSLMDASSLHDYCAQLTEYACQLPAALHFHFLLLATPYFSSDSSFSFSSPPALSLSHYGVVLTTVGFLVGLLCMYVAKLILHNNHASTESSATTNNTNDAQYAHASLHVSAESDEKLSSPSSQSSRSSSSLSSSSSSSSSSSPSSSPPSLSLSSPLASLVSSLALLWSATLSCLSAIVLAALIKVMFVFPTHFHQELRELLNPPPPSSSSPSSPSSSPISSSSSPSLSTWKETEVEREREASIHPSTGEARETGDRDMGLKQGAGKGLSKMVLIMCALFIHSFAEGVSIGVSFCGSDNLGAVITTSLALHNIPEGFATSVVLVKKGIPVHQAALWSIFTSLPQPLMAIPAFMAVTAFLPILPLGLGLAAGAMIWVSLMELVPEAREEWDAQEGTDSNTDKGAVRYRDLQIGVLLVVSAVGMILFTHLLT